MKVLFVTRDKKPGMIATRIARVLKDKGHLVEVVAEGLSVGEWEEAGFSIYSKGSVDIAVPFSINEVATLQEIKPDVVVCGLSSPIRIEEVFARQAILNFTPLVFLDDNWGAVSRSSVVADLVLTIDNLGRDITIKDSRYRGADNRVCVIGDLSASSVKDQIPKETVDVFMQAKGNSHFVFVLASQKWSESDDIIDLGLRSIGRSIDMGYSVVVIPRFHPGADKDSKCKWGEMVDIFDKRYPDTVRYVIDTPDLKHNGDHFAVLADGIFATTGSGLRASAYAGKMPFCVNSSRLMPKLRGESGYDHHPLVIGGAGIEITAPIDVVSLLVSRRDEIRNRQRELLTPLVPFDVEEAVRCITGLCPT